MRRILLTLLCAVTAWGQFFPPTASRVRRGAGAPAAGECDGAGDVGKVWIRSDAASPLSSFYTCSNTGVATYAWELIGTGAGGFVANPVPFLAIYKAAVCQGSSPTLGFSTPVSNPATTVCVTGSNTQFAVAQFTTAAILSVQDHFTLPSDFTGAIDLSGVWRTAETTGSVVWQIATACVASGETADPAFNSASTITDAALAGANQLNAFSTTAITITGCAAGEEFYFRFFRDPDHGSDDLAGTAELVSLTLKIRRTL